MALRTYETAVQLGRLYEIKKRGGLHGAETITPYVSVNTGSVDIHAVTSATQPTALSEMPLADVDTGVSATREVMTAVRYISFKQNTGTTTEIVLSGIEVEDLGAIA